MSTVGRYTSFDAVKGKYPTAQAAISQTAIGSYFIGNAEDELDARVAQKYAVPFAAPVSGFICDLATDIVYYKMTLRQESSEKLGEYIELRIKGLIDGTIVVPGASLATQGSNSAWVSNSYHTTFGMDCDINWRPDCDLIDDTIGSRR